MTDRLATAPRSAAARFAFLPFGGKDFRRIYPHPEISAQNILTSPGQYWQPRGSILAHLTEVIAIDFDVTVRRFDNIFPAGIQTVEELSEYLTLAEYASALGRYV